jgi:GTP cyclohydrolase I
MTSEQLQILSKKFPHLFTSENENFNNITQFSEAVKQLIKLCGDDPERDGLLETPFRVLKAFL